MRFRFAVEVFDRSVLRIWIVTAISWWPFGCLSLNRFEFVEKVSSEVIQSSIRLYVLRVNQIDEQIESIHSFAAMLGKKFASLLQDMNTPCVHVLETT